mgnify:CR=1 FL=1
MKQLFLLPCALLAFSAVNAQKTASGLEAMVNDDLAALNVHFDGLMRFTIDKRDRLVADHLINGSSQRTDMAYVEFLDASTCAYSAEENQLILQCQDPRSKCIDKEIKGKGTVSPTGRLSMALPATDAKGEKARELLVRLVEHKQDAQFSRLAEANTRERKN